MIFNKLNKIYFDVFQIQKIFNLKLEKPNFYRFGAETFYLYIKLYGRFGNLEHYDLFKLYRRAIITTFV